MGKCEEAEAERRRNTPQDGRLGEVFIATPPEPRRLPPRGWDCDPADLPPWTGWRSSPVPESPTE
jgi:hypothetical protein